VAEPFERMPDKLAELPEVMFIQILLCPHCGKETPINIPAKPSSGWLIADSRCQVCGKAVRFRRTKDGSYGQKTCALVTAAFGAMSPELGRVERSCRRVFQSGPLLRHGWEVYQHLAPGVARWSRSRPLAAWALKALLARPIVGATSRNRLVAMLCRLYLALVAVPFVVACCPRRRLPQTVG